MKRILPLLIGALLLCVTGFTVYEQVTSQIRENGIEAQHRADNEKSIANFRTDIAKVQSLVDAAGNKATGEAKQSAQENVWRAKQWLAKAEASNTHDAFMCRFELSTSRLWLKIALKDLDENADILSPWTD